MCKYIVTTSNTRDVAAKKTEETNKEQMLHDMEEQALEDYKVFWDLVFFLQIPPMQFLIMPPVQEKDIVESRDFTAKLYNNEPLPGTEQYMDRYQSDLQGHLIS